MGTLPQRRGTLLPLVVIALLLVVLGVAAYSKFSNSEPPQSKVLVPPLGSQTITGQASVIDGDTIEIHGTRIRLHGIDAPESSQTCTTQGKTYRCGQQAAFALADKIKGGTVECRKKDLDRYGRIVAMCLVSGEDINGWMVAQGWALAYRQYSMDYVGQEAQAKNLKLGIWQGEFEVPSDWRRNHPQRTSTRELSPSTDRPAKPRQAIYYRPGDTFGKRFPSLDGCNQARERDGNVGVCVMK